MTTSYRLGDDLVRRADEQGVVLRAHIEIDRKSLCESLVLQAFTRDGSLVKSLTITEFRVGEEEMGVNTLLDLVKENL